MSIKLKGAVFVLMMLVGFSVHAADLVASKARMKLPGDDTASVRAYVNLKNTSDQEIILIKVRSPAFSLAMIHQTVEDQGEQRMMLRQDLIIKPGAEIRMSSKDVHLMFAGAKTKLKKGDKVRVDLHLNTGEKMPVEFLLVK